MRPGFRNFKDGNGPAHFENRRPPFERNFEARKDFRGDNRPFRPRPFGAEQNTDRNSRPFGNG
jgi:hypothetical protein